MKEFKGFSVLGVNLMQRFVLLISNLSFRVHLAELSLRLSQPKLEFDHLPLHLLVVGLQCADKVAHLSVDGA